MSNAKLKPVAEINLEEFERRLRASAAPQAGVEDPLAELTRLVDTIGFDRNPSERALEAIRPAPKPELRLAPAPAPPPPPPAAKALPRVTPKPAPTPEPPPPVEEVAEEPPLRPSFDAEDMDSLAFEPPEPAPPLADVVEATPIARAPEPPPRARNWGLKVGGLIAAAAVMAGAVVVFKVGGVRHTGTPPLILASTTPTKVAPPSEETIRTANESGSLLTRDTAQPTPTPPKLVNPPEAPVDLAARPQPSPSAASPSPSVSASAQADSPIAPSTDTPIVAAAAPTATPVSPISTDPNRVKTISVRPDGTLISSGYEAAKPAAAAPAPAPTPTSSPSDNRAAQSADAEASSPIVALPTKLSPPKSAARVVSKTDTTAPADDGAGPVPVKPKKPKPEEAKADDADAGGDLPAVANGGYAVQLAAPHSEGEAKALIKRLSGKFADALGGTALGARKAELHGATIYRVRAGGLSKADAASMCSKIKQAGGDCYVAKN